MNSKNIINSIFTIFVVTIMVGMSELFGEKKIIFPEITAISIGFLVSSLN